MRKGFQSARQLSEGGGGEKRRAESGQRVVGGEGRLVCRRAKVVREGGGWRGRREVQRQRESDEIAVVEVREALAGPKTHAIGGYIRGMDRNNGRKADAEQTQSGQHANASVRVVRGGGRGGRGVVWCAGGARMGGMGVVHTDSAGQGQLRQTGL